MKKILFTFVGLLLMIGCDKDATEVQQNRAPSAFALISPAEGVELNVHNITFEWEASEDPDNDNVTYDLYLYKFGEPTIQLASNLSTTSYTLAGRSSFDTSYTWYVVANDGKEKGETTSVERHFVTREIQMESVKSINPSTQFTQKRTSYSALYYDDRLFVINGFNEGALGDVWSSIDYGENWFKRSDIANNGDEFKRHRHSSVVFENKMWVIGGYDNAPVGSIYSSTDGVNWEREIYSATGIDNPAYRYDHSSIAFNDKIWVIGGYDDTSFREDVVSWTGSSEDTWVTEKEEAPFGGIRGHSTVVYNDKIWVIGGKNIHGDLNTVWTTSNGRDWTPSRGLPVNSSYHKSVVFDNKIWVIGGMRGTASSKEIYYYDENTKVWNTYELPKEFEGLYNHTVVTIDEGSINDGIYILGSFDNNTYFTSLWKLY